MESHSKCDFSVWTALWVPNSHAIKFSLLECTAQWFLACPWSCATVNTIHFRTLHHLQGKLPMTALSSAALPGPAPSLLCPCSVFFGSVCTTFLWPRLVYPFLFLSCIPGDRQPHYFCIQFLGEGHPSINVWFRKSQPEEAAMDTVGNSATCP